MTTSVSESEPPATSPPSPALPSLSPALARALARALMPADGFVTREEAIELLPLGADGRQWFDRNVKGTRVVGHSTLFRWGDVAAALNGFSVTRRDDPRKKPAPATGYMTVNAAAEYLGFPTANAFRAAVYRNQFVVSARRGRVWLFLRADLDRQVALRQEREESPSVNADAVAVDVAERSREPAKQERSTTRHRKPVDANDPWGIRAAIERFRAEPARYVDDDVPRNEETVGGERRD